MIKRLSFSSLEHRKQAALDALLPRLRFIDIEASNGGDGSFPIEIGCASIGGNDRSGRIVAANCWSSLIAPAPDWNMSNWNRHAQKVHGISPADLDDAPAASDVARRVRDYLRGNDLVLISDSPKNDQYWLDRLMAAGDLDRLKLVSPAQFADRYVHPDTHKLLKTWLRENPGPHRAGPDAQRLAEGFIENYCHVDRALSGLNGILFHGTAQRFSDFAIPDTGLHFGTQDQAAHAATIQLGRLAAEDFAALVPDKYGWRGRIISVRPHVFRPKIVGDPGSPDAWREAISLAKSQGHDGILYRNSFEGRAPGFSLAVWAQDSFEIIDDDLTRPPPEMQEEITP